MPPLCRPSHARHARRGFTLIEMLVVMVLASLLVGASLQLLDRQRRSARTETLRVDLQQNARYAIDMLTRELQQAGQKLDAAPEFGPVSTVDGAAGKPDSLYIVYADPDTPTHTLNPGGGLDRMKVTITCQDPVNDINPGDMMYVATGSNRGLVIVVSTSRVETWKDCSKVAPTTSLGYVDVTGTTVDQERHGWIFRGANAGSAALRVSGVAYFIDSSNTANPRLMRATEYTNGAWVGVPVADNISDLQVTLVFRNGTTAAVADPTDANPDNDYDDINTVQVDLRAAARRTDKDLNGGKLYTRTYTLSVTPRNQIYTRNLE